MKTYMFVVALLICSTIMGQDISQSQVPSVVVNTFISKFPKTTGLEWERKGELYEAEFDVKNIDHKALLDLSGKLIMFKHDIRPSDLPKIVRNTIRNQYKGYRIDDVEKVDNDGIIFYQVDLDGQPNDQKLVITKDGKVESNQQYW